MTTALFNSTREACLAEADPVLHSVILVLEAAGREVRPAGWRDFYPVVTIETIDDTYIRVLWDTVQPGPSDPATVFRRDEWVVAR